jgi:hypothetical protein
LKSERGKKRKVRNDSKIMKLSKTVNEKVENRKTTQLRLNMTTFYLRRKETGFPRHVQKKKDASNDEWLHCTECTMWTHWDYTGQDPPMWEHRLRNRRFRNWKRCLQVSQVLLQIAPSFGYVST